MKKTVLGLAWSG